MSEQKNSGLICYICVFTQILFAFFYCMPYTYYIFFSPFPVILIFIGIALIIYVAIDESNRRRKRPASYYHQQNYDQTNPYVTRNPVNYISHPRISRSSDHRSNTTLEAQYCRECGASIIIRPSFCQNCGTQINAKEINYSRQVEIIDKSYIEKRAIEIDFCPYCGTKPEKDSIYCSQCGKKLT